ncbi:hypothetical protein A3A93_05785 [Candidatus Roizmanbacteria bacterium RIFCSPLOWO2_01_FULL_38_12]|uniref:Type 4 fimbrial biogenesis protein PilX N-terminal domain-containing protein n=1 Tax=Candidatus Roizmanbacteria bacterium RIFCSPLOWO2_01_FULL_38_12 TaxID=1802061 RepID=A0A1F7IVB0_9BACT|nr:MAG: hypothetical protein A3F59_03425 [Candidatus Roizmanbacteria bacterium RIFCSPHIGHO2_12_FULL_38_13]OGK47273.1 MAG: hypothetical protein A3A93_05785 [Candidatus Roizmanbacteria bacterium RIFCSPLOWO2_01_FULL_38_12]
MNSQKGQTLVTLLVFVVVATSITAAATAIMINTSQASSQVENSFVSTGVAEGGIENALIRLLRNPNYTGETLPIGNGTATITVTGTDPKTITSIGVDGTHTKTIQVNVTYNDNIMTITDWQELF